MSQMNVGGYDEDHEAFRAAVRTFFASELVPRLEDFRRDGAVPLEVYSAAAEHGFLGTAVPEEFGGGGVDDPRFIAVLLEECAASGALGFAQVLANQLGVCIPALLRVPQTAARDESITALAAGAGIAVPVFGVEIGTRKAGVPGAGQASTFVVDVWNNGNPSGTALVSDPASVSRVEDPLGGRESCQADVVFGNPRVGELEQSQRAQMRRDADLWNAVLALAGARHALSVTIDYVTQRKAFGRLVGEFENSRNRLAEVAAEIACVGSFLSSCLDRHSSNDLDSVTSAALRLVATQAHDHAVDQCIQLHGGYGYMREYAIAHAFADARFLAQSAAATSDPRLEIAAGLFA